MHESANVLRKCFRTFYPSSQEPIIKIRWKGGKPDFPSNSQMFPSLETVDHVLNSI